MKIPFNKPYMNGRELFNISQAYNNQVLAGDGEFTKKCQKILSERLLNRSVYLTHSGTAALELALLSLNFELYDEVVVPSFTFVSCANAVLIAGAIPVFADINLKTQNITLESYKNVVTDRTKAIIIVHYAGIGSEITEIIEFSRSRGIMVIEDAAHCLGALYNNQELGTFGDFGCFSFHETKNITCGEGGALVVNNQKYTEKIEIIREKGTNRSKFLKGQVDKYTWYEKGSSYLPSEVTAAFLYSQLEDIDKVTKERKRSWDYYHEKLEKLEIAGIIERPTVPIECTPNGHIYYILLKNTNIRNEIISSLRRLEIHTTFHYIPLHTSPYGVRFKNDTNNMKVSEDNPTRLLRLPLWYGLESSSQDLIVNSLTLIIANIIGSYK